MDTTKLNQFIDQASEEELIYLSAYVRHRLRGRDPAVLFDLELRMREIDAGGKATLDQAWKLHSALQNQGL